MKNKNNNVNEISNDSDICDSFLQYNTGFQFNELII